MPCWVGARWCWDHHPANFLRLRPLSLSWQKAAKWGIKNKCGLQSNCQKIGSIWLQYLVRQKGKLGLASPGRAATGGWVDCVVHKVPHWRGHWLHHRHVDLCSYYLGADGSKASYSNTSLWWDSILRGECKCLEKGALFLIFHTLYGRVAAACSKINGFRHTAQHSLMLQSTLAGLCYSFIQTDN